MAVKTYYGRSRKDPDAIGLAEPVQAEGRSVNLTSGPVVLTNGDDIATRVYLGKVMADWIIDPSSVLYHEAIGTGTTAKIGFEKDGSPTINGSDRSALLGTGLDIAAAGSKSGLAAIATADLGKRIYEWLGYTRNPGIELDIVLTLTAAAAATKAVTSFYRCLKK